MQLWLLYPSLFRTELPSAFHNIDCSLLLYNVVVYVHVIYVISRGGSKKGRVNCVHQLLGHTVTNLWQLGAQPTSEATARCRSCYYFVVKIIIMLIFTPKWKKRYSA